MGIILGVEVRMGKDWNNGGMGWLRIEMGLDLN